MRRLLGIEEVEKAGRPSVLAVLLLLALALTVTPLLGGCAGDDGDDGDDGDTITGPPGPPGPPGADGNPGPIDTIIELAEDLPGVNIEIVSLAGAAGSAFQVGETMEVTFTVEMDNGNPIPLHELDSMRMWLGGPTTLYQKVTGNYSNIASAAVDNGDGTWTYTFPDPIPSTYPTQYGEANTFPENDGLSGDALLDGTYTLLFRAYKNYWDVNGTRHRDVGNVTEDFLLGTATQLEPRNVVSDAACNSCHGTIQMHGGSYRTVTMCMSCHTTGAEFSDSSATTPKREIMDFRVYIHKLHNASHLPSVNGVTVDAAGNKDYTSLPPQPYMVQGHNFVEDVHFPVFPNGMPRDVGYDLLTPAAEAQEDEILDGVTACAKCHVDPDGSGPLTLLDNNAYQEPSRRACGSCHDDIKWDQTYRSNGSGMSAQANDNNCSGCHAASGSGDALAIQEAHRHPTHDPLFTDGINFAITNVDEDPADPNGDGDGTIDPGEKIQVTLTIKDDAGANILPTGRFELLVGGPTENPQLFQRKYMPLDILGGAPAASHTFNVPEFWTLNYVGDYTGVPGGPFPATPVRTPFHTTATGWAPDVQVLEVTGLGAASGTLATDAVRGANHLQLGSVAGFADDDYIVVDRLGANPDYYKVNDVDVANNRLSFGRLDSGNSSRDFGTSDLEFYPWVRVAHGAGTTVEVVTVSTALVENTDYTVDAANGQISTLAGPNWVGNNPILLSAVTDFVMPDVYRQGYTTQTSLDGSMGSWVGLPLLDGTYGVKVGGNMTFTLVPPRTLGTGADETSFNEAGTISTGGEFLVGATGQTLGDYPPILISSGTNCDDCHGVPGERMVFHGRRAGAEYCYNCHGTARFGGGSPVRGLRIMRRMIHGYHMGSDLSFASIFEGGAAEHIHFPMFPGGVKHCDKCHGNDSYTEPVTRDHPSQTVPYQAYATTCLGCHDSTGARAHADLNTAPSGYEACVACHDPGSIYNVELLHKNR